MEVDLAIEDERYIDLIGNVEIDEWVEDVDL